MTRTDVGRLLDATAEDGVAFDGLETADAADGYVFETPDTTRTGLSESTFRDVAAEHESYVTNWHFWTQVAPEDPAGRAFLRWLEGADEMSVPDRYDALADGTARTWGQLLVTVSLADDGTRRYEVRHEDDADVAGDELTGYDDPLDARVLAKHDDRGRYRPLKTAPTLRTGWRFEELSAAEIVETVEFFYPATVANWHRERDGSLDVTHYRETAARQTGMYDVVDDLDTAAIEWMAEACCVDSQCLKRRMWDEDDATALDVARGDGEFPCREPCSLVIAAARKWTMIEREPTETYEFELTPSEKAQLEALIDAVADDRTDLIREADVADGANRYRARYLRAKRVDEDGNLCGVQTDAADDHSHHGH